MTSEDRRPQAIPIELVDGHGARKAAEGSDPYIATAVAIDTPGHDGMAAMGRTFVEEFAMMGWSRDHIARMFARPQFVAAHAVYRARGAAFVEGLISEVLGEPDGEVS
jgi:hypothetical protein